MNKAVDWFVCLLPIVVVVILFGTLWYKTPPMRLTRVGHADMPYHGGAPYGTLLYPVDLARGR